MKAYHIYLLRHGMTQANREGRYVGRTDVPLSPDGEAEIAALAEQCSYPWADAFYTSPMLRCRQTLRILYPDAQVAVVPELAECDFGDFEGKTIDELEENEDYKAWIAQEGRTAPPNGESSPDFQKRCCGAFERIVEELMRSGKERAVIMAHGGTIMFILGAYGYPKRPFYEWLTDNGTGYELVVTPQLWVNGKALEIAARIPENPEDREEYEEEEDEIGADGQ